MILGDTTEFQNENSVKQNAKRTKVEVMKLKLK